MQIKPISYSFPDLVRVENSADFFETIKDNFPQKMSEGIFLEGKKSTIFLYRILAKKRQYHGVLAGVDIEEYLKGNIKKHENTLLKQEENIVKLTLERNAIIKPVLLTYKSTPKLRELIMEGFHNRSPKFVLEFSKEKQIHELYAITKESEIKAFQKLFDKFVNKSYIADGHHRMAAVSYILEQSPELKNHGLNYILCALFDLKELSIMSYNRMFSLSNIDELPFLLKHLKGWSDVKKLRSVRLPMKKHEFIMYTSKGHYSIIWNKKIVAQNKKSNQIVYDIDLFNDYVLTKVFKVLEVRSDPRIQYVEGIKGVKPILKGINENQNLIGFSFFPVKSRDFVKTADTGKILPPKSTWFEPRIRNGIIVQNL
ncbi:MAG: DUF1015 domain-containing protein [Saprospiraceae bacterium]|nr:DUF1015 domain-containing protein [Candidatus Vicinibacter affinis]MBK8641634.1 DUF1015 domain-containing protein [Candidatus Vicinibacter affinis]